jgi:hemolysin III
MNNLLAAWRPVNSGIARDENLVVGFNRHRDCRETAAPPGYGPAAMARGAAANALDLAPARTLRLSGSSLAPRWRGRLHLGACIAAAPAAIALAWHEPQPSIALYATGLVALFAVSAAYHLLSATNSRRTFLRRADHAMIYVFTAACCTPYCIYLVPGAVGRVVLIFAWMAAFIGVLIKVRGFDRWQRCGTALYLLQGWLMATTFPEAAARLPAGEFALILVTGLIYTAGAAVLFTRRPDPLPHVFGYHEVWHAMVVLASACYFAVVWGLPGAGAH